MIKSVHIDGEDYIIRECYNCMFYDSDYISCKYPKKPSKLDVHTDRSSGFPNDCPLGLVEDCCTCKYEAMKDEWVEPCCHCMVSWDSKTYKESTPTEWEVKE